MERILGLDAWLTRGPEEVEHHPRCPLHDDYECPGCVDDPGCPCGECGNEAHTECDPDTHECACAELEAEAKSNKAEAKADELRERKYNP